MRFVGEAGMTLFATASSTSDESCSECGAEEGLVRQEHDDELRGGGELAPVRLLAEPMDVLADVAGVVDQGCATLLVRDVFPKRIEVGDERHLRVDDDVLVAGEPHDHVGAQHVPVGVGGRRLLDEVAMLDHSCHLDDAAKLDLPPASPDVRCAERGDEVARLRPQALLVGPKLAHSLVERSVGLLPRALHALELEIHPLERVLERTDVPGEMRLGQLEEARAVRVERLGRERLDGSLEPLVERPALHLELRFGARQPTLELDHLLHAPAPLQQRRADGEEDGERSDRETDEKGDHDHRSTNGSPLGGRHPARNRD